MELKRVVTLGVFGVLIAVGFLVYFMIYTRQPPIQGEVINNGRDGHGCLVHSGYRWDNSSQSCMKELLDGTKIFQIIDFDSCKDAGYAISQDNKTKALECNAANGMIFVQDSSNKTQIDNSSNSGINYPDYIRLIGTFTIKNSTNSSNSTD